MTKKKWLTLSLVGIALLLIPRRSSRQTLPPVQNEHGKHNKDQNAASDNSAKVDASHWAPSYFNNNQNKYYVI